MSAAPAKKPRVMHGREEAKAAAQMTTAEWTELQVGMAAKWPRPSYMPVHGASQTNYRDETYHLVTRWKADTKIAYRPHAKRPGSKSHVRYEAYSKATSVAEALEMGTLPQDWCWDYEKGFIKVLGPVRDEPLNLAQVVDDSTLTKVDLVLNRWYRREIAKVLGLDHSDLGVNKGSGESTLMRAHRLVAQRTAKQCLEDARKEKRRISDDDVSKTLEAWSFAKNPNRTNVLPDGQDWVFSDTLGLLRDRLGDIHLTAATTMYPDVTRLLNRWLRDRLPKEQAGFTYTSLNLNCNYAARLHRDGNNFGPSFISAFGDFSGGELCYWPEDNRTEKLDNMNKMGKADIKKHRVTLPLRENGQSNLALFNGNSGHSVEPFTGTRFSVVYFTVGCHDSAVQQDKDGLADLGVQFTPPNEDRYRFVREPRGLDASGTPAPKGLTHLLLKSSVWEKIKFTNPTPVKLTGAAEELRMLMEKGRGIKALHEDPARAASGRLKKRPAADIEDEK